MRATISKEIKLKRLCVYCGSNSGGNPVYIDAAKRLGHTIAMSGLGLVYGGGENGLMGVVAKAAIEKSGHVTGIIPTSLIDIENAYRDVNEYYEVDSYHDRKMLMFKLSDAFIALPGGPGTLEELVEQLAWTELGHHHKPIFIVNTNGYWSWLLDMLKQMRTNLFVSFAHKAKYIVVDEPEEAVRMFVTMIK